MGKRSSPKSNNWMMGGAIAPLFALLPLNAVAQTVVFDGTLGPPGEPVSRILPSGIKQYVIRQDQGQTDRSGRNLFHSFSQFDLNANEEAAFRSSVGVQNILVRVTGGSASEINGRLQTSQFFPVNLFLINPNGIVFGPNARIDGVTGSFVATTLDAITFPNGQFNAINPGNRDNLLTLVGDPSGFLASQRQPGAIQITRQNRETSSTDIGIEGLFVREGRSMIFLGGNVTLNDSAINIDRAGQLGRRIELGGIAGAGVVELTHTDNLFSLVFPDTVPKADVAVMNSGIMFAARIGGGIALNARNLTLTNSSILLINGTGGSIAVNAQNLTASRSDLILAVQGASSLDSPQGGTVHLNVATLALANSVFSSEVREGGTAKGGDVDINTQRLTVQNSQIRADTFGTGDAGNLTVNATRSVELSGDFVRGAEQGPGGLFAQVNSTLTTTGIGQGGNLTVITPHLRIQDGSKVQTATFGRGNAGNVLIRAQDIEVIDTDIPNIFPTAINAGATLTLNPQIDARGDLRGNGGNLTIETDRLDVRGSEITVENFGIGSAGNLFITARDRIRLSDRSKLTAETRSGQGGDITLKVNSFLLLRNNSQISTNAGTLQFPGIGGNILINTPFVISAPLENNDIAANAFGGSGGRIEINAQSILGLVPQTQQDLQRLLGTNRLEELDPTRLLTNDITAISRTSPTLNGIVVINTPGIDPSRGLIALPANLVDPAQQIAQGCSPRGKQAGSSFIATGRGGLPLSPYDPLQEQAVLSPWVTLAEESGQRDEGGGRRDESGRSLSVTPYPIPHTPHPTEIIEAQGWVTDASGNIYLTANSQNISHTPPLPAVPCPTP